MALRTLLLPLVLALALAGCSSRPIAATPPPTPTETPPTTKDPGAVEDERPLQSSPPPRPRPETGAAQGSAGERRGEPDGAPCLVGPECASGVCEGEGCTDDRPGTCAPRARACTRDLRQYCGCDGKTFGASGTCPGRRFAARAPCRS
jgi:hypothetical protein